MEKAEFFQRKSIGEYISAAAVVLAVITLIYYCSYTGSMGSINPTIVVFIILAAVCNLIYFFVDVPLVADIGILEIVASVFMTLAIVYFFLNSWSNLADLLNGIQIFSGGKGSLASIITIMVLLFVVELAEIVSCFMTKNKRVAD